MADYWIKLYHEIIDDPKMATLPDRLWRRAIELFLLAGRLCQDKSGQLPDTRQLAWLLRMNSDEMQHDLDQLMTTGIIEPIPNGWLIVNFQKRQSASSSTERVKQYRERERKQQYYNGGTKMERFVPQINRLTESETEEEKSVIPSSPSFSQQETAALKTQFNENGHYRILEKVYTQATRQSCIPPDQTDKASQFIQAILDELGGDESQAIEECKRDFSVWCNTIGKSGRKYSPLNTGWLSKTLERLVTRPETSAVDKTQSDLERALASLKG